MEKRTAVPLLLVVVILAVFFGAPGLLSGEDPNGPGPEGTPTDTPLPQAPGVGPETLENVTALLETYRGSMTNVGFVAEARTTNATTVYTYARNGSRMIEQQNGSRVLWTNGTVTLAREESGGNVTYSRPPAAALSVERLTRASRFEVLLTAAGYERDGTAPCGDTTCVVLTATGSGESPYRNFTAEVHVDRTGVIHRFEAEYVRDFDDRQFDLEFVVTQLGKESIARPDWVGEGLNATA